MRSSQERETTGTASRRIRLAGVLLLAAVTLTGCSGATGAPTPSDGASATTPPASATAGTPSPTAAGAEERAAVRSPAPFEPELGMCLDARKDAVPGPETIVSCDEEHDDEVYAVFDLADGAFPGDSAVEGAARAGCLDRFAAFIGIPFAESVLEVYTFHPDEAAWSSGDRRVACVVWNPSDTVTGSLAGAGY
ncbi:septum formation family protein [Agromyces sp. G08B096]|uniref:Septum formation family protein n=1 Tax=Agromyces sp. G08B096 TaxID=3156399 RepID=A0AAU7WCY4_9MICO